jgi:hypothetical protein
MDAKDVIMVHRILVMIQSGLNNEDVFAGITGEPIIVGFSLFFDLAMV